MERAKMQPDHVHQISAATVATAASYTSSGGLIVAGLTLHDFSIVFGMVLATLTFFINWYYRHREWKRGQRHH